MLYRSTSGGQNSHGLDLDNRERNLALADTVEKDLCPYLTFSCLCCVVLFVRHGIAWHGPGLREPRRITGLGRQVTLERLALALQKPSEWCGPATGDPRFATEQTTSTVVVPHHRATHECRGES